ncbi:MAG: 50S ribosomal protein L29 [Candidatus Lightella neohaematopini]|nr:50S ribosomal protein L29 [Candidatus Lightella neohaematopini]MCV2531380.1 50S ribosomal protein L29 [Candidatus Lightella neohaematopini]
MIIKKNLKNNDLDKLYKELNELLLTRFNIRIQFYNNKLKQVHIIKKNRRDIARIKTIISIKKDIS